MTTANIILSLATTSTGLIAGLFYSYSCSINPGLARLPDREYLNAMQSINRAILNAVFFSTFAGTLLLLPVTTYLYYGQPVSARFAMLLSATLVYAVGVFGVTMFGNVPLNNTLDAFNMHSASKEDIARLRAQFEAPWNRLHTVRTIASIIVFILVVFACLNDL